MKLKGYWAGRLVLEREVKKPLLEQSLDEIELALKNGELMHTTVGVIFVLDALCVDVYKKNTLFKMFQFKK